MRRFNLMFFSLAVLIGIFTFSIRPALAQDEKEAPEEKQAEKKGHPAIPGFPGFTLQESEQREFGAYEFSTGPDGQTKKRIEGKSWQLTYGMKEGTQPPTSLEVIRNYENAFKKRGGVIEYTNDPETGGDGYATFRMSSGGSDLWVALEFSNDNIIFNLIEAAPMAQKVELSAGDMAKALASTGRIALHGILFDTGKANIKPESNPVLDEIAKLLKSDPSLKLSVEGHTDNVGQKAANLDLSKKRAAAVRAALVSRGIDDDRLSTQGFGDTKPVADNSAEKGRAQNRRVELVKL